MASDLRRRKAAKAGTDGAPPPPAEGTPAKPGVKYIFDRHYAVKVALALLAVAAVPILALPVWHLLRQEVAVTQWPAVRCEVHSSAVKDLGRERRRMLRLRKEFAPNISYSFVWPADGANYTSDSVYYFSKISLPSGSVADRVAKSFRPGGPCTAYVNPADPTESILVREVWFRPYTWLLFLTGSLLGIAWFALAEYDWNIREYNGERFPPLREPSVRGERWLSVGDPAPGQRPWYLLQTQEWIPPPRRLLPMLAVALLWHAVGAYCWLRFTALPRGFGGFEQQGVYHAVGAFILLRAAYAAAAAWRVCEPQICIDAPCFEEGRRHVLRVRQRRRRAGGGPLRYTLIDVRFTLRETYVTHGKRKAAKHTALKHDASAELGCSVALPRGYAGMEAFWSIDIPTLQSLGLTETSPSKPIYHDWTVEIGIKLSGVPSTYGIALPVTVKAAPEPTPQPQALAEGVVRPGCPGEPDISLTPPSPPLRVRSP
eukprot:TRINITY_DN50884_c0_g1_i1.p1 TRINITY_DN50884_c0_g1~~TRINITY_DN50884_c0_g1_i1.p1  ORF type:complete len:516 (+),score=150.20 TRINITY_DN50884_c0_g1_i1:93-1550(+)